jgi:hypothetical protein
MRRVFKAFAVAQPGIPLAEALSDKTIEVVKSTVPTQEARSTAVTDRMYLRLFQQDQAVRST